MDGRSTTEDPARAALVLLGASGFLGAQLLRVAAERWPGPVVAVARSAPRGALAGPERTTAGAAVEWRALDVEDEPALRSTLDEVGPAAVVLAAALSRMGASDADPHAAGRLNADVPGRVAAWSRASGARLVHVSTDLVFGGAPPRPQGYREDDPPAPRSTYGRTKAEGERRVLAADPDALVVRLPLLFGDSLGRGLGASDQLTDALARGERPALFADEVRTPLDVEDAAAALVELAAAGAPAGRLHVAGPRALDRHALGLLVLAAHGLDASGAAARLERTTRAARGLAESRPANVALDAARARRVLRTVLRAPEDALGLGPERGPA